MALHRSDTEHRPLRSDRARDPRGPHDLLRLSGGGPLDREQQCERDRASGPEFDRAEDHRISDEDTSVESGVSPARGGARATYAAVVSRPDYRPGVLQLCGAPPECSGGVPGCCRLIA